MYGSTVLSKSDGIGRLIQEMSAEVEEGPAVYRPSRFWELVGGVNESQLSERGFETFKRTINQNYFNWLIANPKDVQFRALIRHWIAHPSPSVATAALYDWAGIETVQRDGKVFARRRRRIGHALFVAMLWEYARGRDRLGWLEQVSEPSLGNPILVRHRGRLVSQDLANSVLELASMMEAFPEGFPEGATVIELGGGYGRIGWLMLSVLKGVRYVAVDIPPALAVAQEYLTRLFPDLPATRFQRGTRHLASALESTRMAFLTPNQLDAVAPMNADLFINVSSLHEMRPDQVVAYFDLIGRHTAGVFYSKQWITSTNSQDGVTIRQSDYSVPSGWTRVFERRHPVQTGFFEAAYRVRSRRPTESSFSPAPAKPDRN
jgi:putative sugar O-methyltransferase